MLATKENKGVLKMSVVINTNVDALKIQSILTNSTNKLSQSMQRMSSGLKINSAADDAAGTVISARMNVQLSGNKTCQNNIQNANAMLATAEGNIDVVLENVSRIRDLTLQAKNGTYSTEEKAALQQEVDERILEINRVSDSAKFSQLQLFGGDLAEDGITFQVGANSSANDTIEISSEKGVFDTLNFYDILTLSTPAQDAVSATSIDTVKDFKTKSEITSKDDWTAGDQGVYYATDKKQFYEVKNTAAAGETAKYEAVKVERIKYTDATVDNTLTKAVSNGKTGDGETVTVEKGKLYKGLDDKMYMCTDTTSKTLVEVPSSIPTGDADAQEASVTNPFTEGTFDLSEMTAGEDTTAGTFAQAIKTLDEAIDNLTVRKSAIGSAQSRMQSALSTLTTQYTNLSSAKSIITDADIASEASAYTQNQILQQVSVSLLAQANQAPSVALSLL